ncbi:Poly(ADPribose) polymerase catalytic domain containing protein, variant 2 [Balamuthia mandrillaris]
MPPRRAHKAATPPSSEAAASAASASVSAAAPVQAQPPAANNNNGNGNNNNYDDAATTTESSKKRKAEEEEEQKTKKKQDSDEEAHSPTEEEEEEEEEEDDDRPVCWYGSKCYRKNPQHFKEFRHPHLVPEKKQTKATSSKSKKRKVESDEDNNKTSSSSVDVTSSSSSPSPSSAMPSSSNSNTATASAAPPAPASRPEVDNYRSIVRVTVQKNKITAAEKQLLRGFRRTYSISQQEHLQVLSEFGWTEEQYEDGERRDDTVELDEEHDILQSENGYGIIKLKKGSKMTQQQENCFSKAVSHFYQTMSKAQANYQISEVWVIVNRDLKQQYEEKKADFLSAGKDINEVWGFHGSTRNSMIGISKTGFLPPDKLPSQDQTNKKSKKKKTQKKVPDITVLDDGLVLFVA